MLLARTHASAEPDAEMPLAFQNNTRESIAQSYMCRTQKTSLYAAKQYKVLHQHLGRMPRICELLCLGP